LLQRTWTPPYVLQRLARQRSDRVGARHVGEHAEDVVLLLPQRRDGALERALLDVGEDDLHAFLRETRREAEADAAGGAGNNRYLALEVLHQILKRRVQLSLAGLRGLPGFQRKSAGDNRYLAFEVLHVVSRGAW
jgi:hypothetical protein